jgi:hypothetical protein
MFFNCSEREDGGKNFSDKLSPREVIEGEETTGGSSLGRALRAKGNTERWVSRSPVN